MPKRIKFNLKDIIAIDPTFDDDFDKSEESLGDLRQQRVKSQSFKDQIRPLFKLDRRPSFMEKMQTKFSPVREVE